MVTKSLPSPKAPYTIVLKMDKGSSPVKIFVTIPHTISARRIATALTRIPVLNETSVRLEMRISGSFVLVLLVNISASRLCHQ